MIDSSIEESEPNMLERMAIRDIARKAVEIDKKDISSLEEEQREYIFGLGKNAEKYFYFCINSFENEKKYPKVQKKDKFMRYYTQRKR
jgi:hypothetical protein